MRTKRNVLSPVLFFTILALVITFAGACATAPPLPVQSPALVPTEPPASTPKAEGRFDPKALIGEWEGEWSASAWRDKIYLTVKSASSETVTGVLYLKGPAQHHNRDIPVSGKVTPEGLLTLRHPDGEFWLNYLPPDQLKGRGVGTRAAEIELKRK